MVDWRILAGTLLAFFFGLGIGAHAFDEVHDRPLRTGLSDRALWVLGVGGLAAGGAMGVAGAFIISPWLLVWVAIGLVMAAGYGLEWSPLLHSDWGFGVAWGAFPVLVGYWAQTESLSIAVILVAAATTVLSRAQRELSTPARRIRRTDDPDRGLRLDPGGTALDLGAGASSVVGRDAAPGPRSARRSPLRATTQPSAVEI